MLHAYGGVFPGLWLALLVALALLLRTALVARRTPPAPYRNPAPLFRTKASAEAVAQVAHRGSIPTKLRPSPSSRRYCLITPCRDEERYARRTLDAVTSQTEPPGLWIIVDDGSKDGTPRILQEYAVRFPFIRVITRSDRGVRKVGAGVIEAFYAGYDTIDPGEFDYVCKLDLDLDLPPRYFELVMDWMEAFPRVGTCSGKPYFHDPNVGEFAPRFPLTSTTGLVSEMLGDENAVGAIKFYRTSCFQEIGGFAREVMWDGIDGHRCRQLGWIAVSSDDPQLRFLHLRPMGTSHKNWWTGRVRHGYGQYYMGTTPVYMLVSAVYRMTRPPRVVGGIAMLYGYVKSMLNAVPRYGDAEFRRFLRRYQWGCLLLGKARTTAAFNAEREARWDAVGVRSASLRKRGLIGDILVRARAVTREKLDEALAAQRGAHAGRHVGEILLLMRAISKQDLIDALATQLGLGDEQPSLSQELSRAPSGAHV